MRRAPFALLACALLASCGPVFVSTSEQIADSTSTSSYFRFDMEDVYATCGSSVPLVYSTNLSSYEIRSSDEGVTKIVDGQLLLGQAGRANIVCGDYDTLHVVVSGDSLFMIRYEDDELRLGAILSSPEILGIDEDDITLVSYVSTDESVIRVSEDGSLTAVGIGEAKVYAVYGGTASRPAEFRVLPEAPLESIELSLEKAVLYIGDWCDYEVKTNPEGYESFVKVVVDDGLTALDGYVSAYGSGSHEVYAEFGGVKSNSCNLTVAEYCINDLYFNVDPDDFYADYEPAHSYYDAYYRTAHNLLSGTLIVPDQEVEGTSFAPMEDGKFEYRAEYAYKDEGNAYAVYDYRGDLQMMIYRGGAYIGTQEIAAYLLAYSDVPANYSAGKLTSPITSPWKEYLRVNNTSFSGSTHSYPYQPELPDITGCGGDLNYYEIDIGTTGTDCDPLYIPSIYNDGRHIDRGAARMVYTRYKMAGGVKEEVPLEERHVFYTYNHYNDFQEYLNYYEGWGQMFGNVSGGGALSSKDDCNPTAYPEVVRSPLA